MESGADAPWAPGQAKVNEVDDSHNASATETSARDSGGDSVLSSPVAATTNDQSDVSTAPSSFLHRGHSSQQDHSDRFFPIRSVIQVDSSVRVSGDRDGSPGLKPISEDSSLSDATLRQSANSGYEDAVLVRRIPISFDDLDDNETEDDVETSSTSESAAGREADSEGIPELLYTQRMKHFVTDQGHAVISGRHGTPQRCEDEPIHTPGAVQAFGLMLVIYEEKNGWFQVRYVSENSKRIIGYTPQQLFKLHNFLDILTNEQAENLLDHIAFIRDEDADPGVNGPEVFALSIRPPHQQTVKLWCAIHIPPGQPDLEPDLIICEFELDDDHDFPLCPNDASLEVPEDTLRANPTMEELSESTETLSKPLRILRNTKKRRGDTGAMQVFDILGQVQEQLSSAPDLNKFLKILVGIIKELTGFHRVMIYQFDSSFNGKVVTELVDFTKTMALYKGLNFPASDIPSQARELYNLNKVRLIYDRDLKTARIVCRTVEDLAVPLDMTHSYLRAISPIHLKYLGNMAVRSSMSISINAFDELWGLIACHSYGDRGMRVSFPTRKLCRLVGYTVSRNIERLSYASRLQARKLINTVPTNKNPSGYIIASSDDLLQLFDADFGMLSIRGETKILGQITGQQESLAMLEYLRLRKITTVSTSQDIRIDFPDLRYPPGFSSIAGLLYVPLSSAGQDFIVFFRKGQIKEVRWAGNPYEKIIQQGTTGFLEPRKSFEIWKESVTGKCREWTEAQIETAAVLCLVYGKFIEVWRQKEAAMQTSRLTRLLLANSAHEVRTPLNAIINYLEIAMESTLDLETRDNLTKSHSASKALIYVINDLLDLTKTEEGQELIRDERFDFSACIQEATEPFKNDARRKGITYEVTEHEGLPRYMLGDQRRVRQAVANITANAMQHTTQGGVKIESYVAEIDYGRVWVEIVIQDTGRGMDHVQLDNLFRELEQVSSETEECEQKDKEAKPIGSKMLGLGLALVARIVRNMNGQLRLKSEEGKGSRFVLQLPFDLPPEDELMKTGPVNTDADTQHSRAWTLPSVSTVMQKAQLGEMTLVERAASIAYTGLSSKHSFEDTHSVHSQNSGMSRGSAQSGMSDADRLIDAIQTPLTYGEAESEEIALQRRVSRSAYYQAKENSKDLASRSTSPGRERSHDSSRPQSCPDARQNPSSPKSTSSVGMAYINDSKMPIKAVKVPDDYHDQLPNPQEMDMTGLLFEIIDSGKPKRSGRSKSTERPSTSTTTGSSRATSVALTSASLDASIPASCKGTSRSFAAAPTETKRAVRLKVLVAEDDPINVRVLRKRLERAGHEVLHTVNGQDCASVYEERAKEFDVILMDMQMPIVDGLTSTKLIRAYEHSSKHDALSRTAMDHGRIPIFAVSASLVERNLDIYVHAGFDGWILKPIDFKRLETLMAGIVDDDARNKAVYVENQWERGGWFRKKNELPAEDQAQAADKPSGGTTLHARKVPASSS